jgi:hypothetical protein
MRHCEVSCRRRRRCGLWVVTLWELVCGYQCFGGTRCLHLQGWRCLYITVLCIIQDTGHERVFNFVCCYFKKKPHRHLTSDYLLGGNCRVKVQLTLWWAGDTWVWSSAGATVSSGRTEKAGEPVALCTLRMSLEVARGRTRVYAVWGHLLSTWHVGVFLRKVICPVWICLHVWSSPTNFSSHCIGWFLPQKLRCWYAWKKCLFDAEVAQPLKIFSGRSVNRTVYVLTSHISNAFSRYFLNPLRAVAIKKVNIEVLIPAITIWPFRDFLTFWRRSIQDEGRSTVLCYTAESFLRSLWFPTQSKNSRPFMGPKVSFPCP